MASQRIKLASGVEETGVLDEVSIRVPPGKSEVPCIVRGITTATVAIEGSIDGANFVKIVDKTADAAFTVPVFPFMRVNVTAYTSGEIDVDLYADRAFVGS